MYRADKRIYVTADRSRVVDEGDPDAAFLLAAEGGEIADDEAERLGLTGKRKASAPEPEVVHSIAADPVPADDDEPKAKVSARTEDKAVDGPKAGDKK